MDITVIVPVYGPADEALPLLRAVAHTNPPVRTIVVDDASPVPVNSHELPASVEIVRRDRNGGFGAAVNTGLNLVRTTYALVLNSDLTIPDGFIPNLLAHASPFQPAVIGPRAVDPHGRSAYSGRYWTTTRQQVIEWLVPLASQRHRAVLHEAVGHDVRADRAHGLVPVDWVSGCAMLLPVEQVREVGGFDEEYFMYCEEVDLQKRLAERGVPALLDADLTVVHEGGGSSSSERRRRWLVAARDRYARKFGRPRLLRLGLLSATGVNLLWNLGRRAAGRAVDPLAVARFEVSLVREAARSAR
ncbi:glycosyltransferase family 2 protein [Devriesea agamarum]|uniref:glycosyltransferase family 2 protein n=1 Tax=Devriesea agamarum TaxID=472569 RepID=UPI000AAF2346|nr:glycosyltransferase family 2 protein [Devriesea agamarum]